VLGCDWTVQTQPALDAIADVMLVVRRLEISGAVSSLAPLGKLVKVGSLTLDAPAVESIEPLRALRHAKELMLANLNALTLDALDQLDPVPEVRILGAPKLRTLAGLGSLQATTFVVTDAPELESLADLSLADDCRFVSISNAPKLTNVEALSAIREVDTLELDRVGVESLQDINDVRIRSYLTIANNARLNYLGLAGAVIDDTFELRSNPALTAPGGLDTTRFSVLRLDDNDALTTLVGLPRLDDCTLALTGNDSLTNLEGVSGERTVLRVNDNASLQSASGLELEDATTIAIDGNPALEDLSALTGVSTEDLSVANSPKLEALPAVAVSRQLTINDNAELIDIGGFEIAAEVSTVSVARNPKLSSLDGFELTAAGGLSIDDNPALVDFSALAGASVAELSISNSPELVTLPAIRVGPGSLEISNNAQLTSISALQSAVGVSTAYVVDNPKLSSLSGLPLAKVLYIQNDASIVDLSGFDIRPVLEELVVQDNPRLQSLRALNGVTSVGNVVIFWNDALPDCEVAWFGARIGQQLPLEVNGPIGPCP
jgi:hypothetical protein